MRLWIILVGTIFILAGIGVGARAGDKPSLELADPQLPIYELRPQDRRVYGITLEGTWHTSAKSGANHYVNVLFENGQTYSVRVDEHPTAARKLIAESKGGKVSYRQIEDSPFRRGEVRCLIPNNQIIRNGLANGGKFKVVVSVGKPVTSAKAPEVVSNALELSWPLDRAIAKRPPRSRHSDVEAVDAMPSPSEEPRGTIRVGGGG